MKFSYNVMPFKINKCKPGGRVYLVSCGVPKIMRYTCGPEKLELFF